MRPLTPLKLVMVTEGRIASALILDRVFSGLHRQGAWDYQACYEWDSSFPEIGQAVDMADVVVFLRCTRPEEAALLERAKRRDLATVYCVDDDFDALDPSTTLGQFYGRPEMREGRDQIIRNVDMVWVFTREMEDRLRDRCRRIHVGRLPSFVEDHGWDLRSIDDEDTAGPLIIGYGGRYIHLPDLEVIVEPLRQILDSCGRSVRAEFVDCLPPALKNHPKVTHIPHFDAIDKYYRYVRTAAWAIGLAPLLDSVGNRGKTNNKYREYAALGVPGIYSDMPVYASSVRHRETGYLAPHTEQGMYEAMLALIRDAQLRKRIRRRALADAATTYALLPMQQEWLREVSLLASQRVEPVSLLVVAHEGVTSTQIDALPAARCLEQQGRLRLDYSQPAETRFGDVARSDAVFLVRAFEPKTLGLLKWAGRADVALICAWDDDFYSLASDTLLGKYHAEVAVRSARSRFLRECSLIASSTPPLTERSLRFNSNVMEAIYGFDTTRLPIEPLSDERGEGALRMGFFGLQWAIAPECVRDAVRRVKQRFGQRVEFEIISSWEIPADSTDLLDWHSAHEMSWAESLRLLRSRGWDIGLAPLKDTPFNSAKQATKFRDYAWAGTAIVCSRVPAYQRALIDGIHALMVDNTTAAWEGAIARLIEDQRLRLRLRQAARDLFAQAHTLDATICSWHQLVWRIARHRDSRHQPEAERRRRRASWVPLFRRVPSAPEAGMISASPPLTSARFYEIVPHADGWATLDVMLGLHLRPAAGRLVLSIYADGLADEPLRCTARDLTEAVDNGLLRFSFPPIVNSRQRRMLLRFHVENPGPDTRISLYEHGQRSRSLVARVLRRLSSRGGVLYCDMGFQD